MIQKYSEEVNEETKERETFQFCSSLFVDLCRILDDYHHRAEPHSMLTNFRGACNSRYWANSIDEKNGVEKLIAWFSAKTGACRAASILSPKDTTPILANAFYFKGAWQDRFEKDHTEESDFFVTPDETSKAQLMFQEVKRAYCYSSDLACQVLKLPYKSSAASMVVLLPDRAKSSLDAVEAKLTVGHLAGFDSEFQEYPDVRLWFPKFKIEVDLELKEVLSELGMRDLFVKDAADLSGMDGNQRLYASKVQHKAFVEVNEDGTEAAAATAMKVQLLTAGLGRGEEPVTFRADHPFLFFIREEATKAVLFLGRVVRPLYS